MKLLILNGPNLNLLGVREPDIYGSTTFEDFFKELSSKYSEVELDYFQSNHEGVLIDTIHESVGVYDGIVFNAGAFAHYSIALSDSIAAINVPVIEVHISNVFGREDYRQSLVMAKNCKGFISGFGLKSYELAIQSFLK